MWVRCTQPAVCNVATQEGGSVGRENKGVDYERGSVFAESKVLLQVQRQDRFQPCEETTINVKKNWVGPGDSFNNVP